MGEVTCLRSLLHLTFLSPELLSSSVVSFNFWEHGWLIRVTMGMGKKNAMERYLFEFKVFSLETFVLFSYFWGVL